MVHAVLAARSTTQAQAGAGEVLIREEAAVGNKLTCYFPIEALTQCLQGFEDDHWGAWGTGGVVIQELLQFILQATEVSRGAEGLRSPVLDRTEGLWETGKLLEALRQQTIY